MKYLLLIVALYVPVLLARTFSSFDPPEKAEVLPTIRRSLMRSLPVEVRSAPVSDYLSADSIRKLENILGNEDLKFALEVKRLKCFKCNAFHPGFNQIIR